MHASVRRPLLALALFALPALAVAGCGGDDKKASNSSGGGTALSADAWRAAADAICADIQTRQDAVAAPTGPAEVQTYLETILPLGKEQVSRIKELVPPAELQSIQSQAVANQDAAVAIVEKAIDRIKGGEDATKVVTELTAEVQKITAEGDRLAQEAGLTKCGKEGDSTATTTDATTETQSTESTTTSETPTIPTTGDAAVDKFLADVQKATGALTAFGEALGKVGSPDEIKKQVASLRGQLGDFDAAIASMDGYTLDNATVEGQRSRLVASGPKVSDVLREFIDAGATGDLTKIGEVLPRVAKALQEFTTAAQP